VTTIKYHAHRLATSRRINEHLRSATLDVASKDVTCEQIACVEGGTPALRNAFR
jgi:hypothetical protein